MFFNIDVPQETTASAHRRALFRDMGSRNRKAPLSPCLGAVWSGATGSFRFGVPPTEGQRWVGFRPGQRAELVEVSRTPVAFPPPDDLSRADHAGGERITTRFSALLMHVEGVRPEQTENRRIPERVLPRLWWTPRIQAVHRLHVGFQKA